MFEWFYKLFVPTESPDITQSLVVVMMVIGIGVFIGRLRLGKISLGVSAVMFSGLFFKMLVVVVNGMHICLKSASTSSPV